jgi:hypothetical protein
MRVVDPITLIGMKLDVDENVNPVRRSKDLSDIIALLGVIERDRIRSEDIKIKLNESQFRSIGNILDEYPECSMNGKKGYILMPSLEYVQEIIKLGEEK